MTKWILWIGLVAVVYMLFRWMNQRFLATESALVGLARQQQDLARKIDGLAPRTA